MVKLDEFNQYRYERLLKEFEKLSSQYRQKILEAQSIMKKQNSITKKIMKLLEQK